MRYAQIVNTGKGFITHADRLSMSFSSGLGDTWELEGDPVSINTWLSRVNAVEKTAAEVSEISNNITKFIYAQEEFFVRALRPSEAYNILTAASTDADVSAIVARFFQGSINSSSTEFSDLLDLLVAKGLVTKGRKTVLKAGR